MNRHLQYHLNRLNRRLQYHLDRNLSYHPKVFEVNCEIFYHSQGI